MTISNKLVRDWLAPQITTGARVLPGREPDNGRVIVITVGGGAGPILEGGLFDIVNIGVRCRGAEQNLDDAEAIALEVDKIMMGAPENFIIGDDVKVQYIGRTGGAPSQLPFSDADSAFVFTCNYFAVASTNLGL